MSSPVLSLGPPSPGTAPPGPSSGSPNSGITSFLDSIMWSYHGAMPFTLIPLLLLLWRKGKAFSSQPQLTNQTNQPLPKESAPSSPVRGEQKELAVTILYSTTTGTARKLSEELLSRIQRSLKIAIRAMDLKDYDVDNLENEQMVFFVCSTWTDGTLAQSSHSFLVWLEDLANDFRISKMHLGKLKYAIFGLGGQIYGDNFCKASRELDEYLLKLGASPLLTPSFGDDASDLLSSFRTWSQTLEATLRSSIVGDSGSSGGCCQQKEATDCGCTSVSSKRTDGVKRLKGTKRPKKAKAVPTTESSGGCCDDEAEEEDMINDTFVLDSDDDDDATCATSAPEDDGLVDLEDIGPAMAASVAVEPATSTKVPEREMVTKLQRKALTKEGYKIIGTHSAVKMCRWTKNQMRGRGGCYKHSFYGITSYQCMEATPSLACANKCVFCWRHHKNPVGTEWRWKTDPPSLIVDQAISEHQAMVNQMRGVPGVVPERFQEAFTVRHCALSLVGEPIMYPHINEMLRLLHERKISSFLVTNAQFPDAILALDPVTQLYVSVDAATKDSLKAVDRPLFKDFWERFRQSLAYMKEKQQRTVYRMTLVKSYNMDEVEQYCDLIQEGEPDFIEIKAVTYCGKSDASNLTMQNVPWHYEVCSYAEAIVQTLNSRSNARITYGIATEHEHSCCILIAREDRFKVNGQWYTWIDYPKFDELIKEYYESNGTKTFVSTDYLAPTPEWALYKSSERGFDPKESRYRRTKTGALVEVEYKSSESGCG